MYLICQHFVSFHFIYFEDSKRIFGSNKTEIFLDLDFCFDDRKSVVWNFSKNLKIRIFAQKKTTIKINLTLFEIFIFCPNIQL